MPEPREVQDATFRLTLETPASRQDPAEVLYITTITNPKLNEPVRLSGLGSSPSRDMVPIIARLRLLSGSAEDFRDAIVSVRIRRRRRSFHEET